MEQHSKGVAVQVNPIAVVRAYGSAITVDERAVTLEEVLLHLEHIGH